MYRKDFDLSVALELSVTPELWSQSEQMFLDNPELNTKLIELKLAVLRRYNLDYCSGVLISKQWLQNVISESFGRPVGEVGLQNNDAMIYLTDFSRNWLNTKAVTWKTGSNKYMSPELKKQYSNFVSLLGRFEENSMKLVMKDLTTDKLYSFVNWMMKEKFSYSKIDRELGRLRFFMARAKEDNIRVNEDYLKRIFIEKDEDMEKAFLTQAEINKILNTDFSFDPELQIAKQHYTILLFTGMRANDVLKNLDISNIDNDLIKIKTSKTGQSVVIPMHPEVKKVLKQNFGHFPPKITLLQLNSAIKKMAQVCEIDQPTKGKVFCNKTKRKIAGVYKKYELLSSHSARRGFATLYKGIISDDAICSILGWSSQAMLKVYNQKSKEDYAEELKRVWN